MPNIADSSLKGRPIATVIVEAGRWWDAEDYHQEYCMYLERPSVEPKSNG